MSYEAYSSGGALDASERTLGSRAYHGGHDYFEGEDIPLAGAVSIALVAAIALWFGGDFLIEKNIEEVGSVMKFLGVFAGGVAVFGAFEYSFRNL